MAPELACMSRRAEASTTSCHIATHQDAMSGLLPEQELLPTYGNGDSVRIKGSHNMIKVRVED